MRKVLIAASLTIIGVFFSSHMARADGYEGEAEPAVKEASAGNGLKPTRIEAAAPALETAHGEDLAAALGHYAKSRSLLVSAIDEFDRGYKLARPDSLIDSREWRSDLISRAEDLEKVLAPQPRVSKSGVKFEADRRLLKTNEGSR